MVYSLISLAWLPNEALGESTAFKAIKVGITIMIWFSAIPIGAWIFLVDQLRGNLRIGLWIAFLLVITLISTGATDSGTLLDTSLLHDTFNFQSKPRLFSTESSTAASPPASW